MKENKETKPNEDPTNLNEDLTNLISLLEDENKDKKFAAEITDENNPLVVEVKKNWKKLGESKFKNSYTSANIHWKDLYNKEKIYFFRIAFNLGKKKEDLIRKEYQMHEKNKLLNDISPEFICYYFSKSFNFSIFIIRDNSEYYTLEEILENKDLYSKLDFSKQDLFISISTTIEKLIIEDKDDIKYYICPYLTPSNLIYLENPGKDYFLLTEIFLETDSPEKETDIIELPYNRKISNWLVPELVNKKPKLTFASNIFCLGKLLYKVAFNREPEKQLKIEEDSIYKELIEMCMNTKDIKERPTINDILEYINENNFDELEEEINTKENQAKEKNLLKDENKLKGRDIEDIKDINKQINNDEKENKEKNENNNINEVKDNKNILIEKEINEKNNKMIIEEANINLKDDNVNNINNEITENKIIEKDNMDEINLNNKNKELLNNVKEDNELNNNNLEIIEKNDNVNNKRNNGIPMFNNNENNINIERNDVKDNINLENIINKDINNLVNAENETINNRPKEKNENQDILEQNKNGKYKIDLNKNEDILIENNTKIKIYSIKLIGMKKFYGTIDEKGLEKNKIIEQKIPDKNINNNDDIKKIKNEENENKVINIGNNLENKDQKNIINELEQNNKVNQIITNQTEVNNDEINDIDIKIKRLEINPKKDDEKNNNIIIKKEDEKNEILENDNKEEQNIVIEEDEELHEMKLQLEKLDKQKKEEMEDIEKKRKEKEEEELRKQKEEKEKKEREEERIKIEEEERIKREIKEKEAKAKREKEKERIRKQIEERTKEIQEINERKEKEQKELEEQEKRKKEEEEKKERERLEEIERIKKEEEIKEKQRIIEEKKYNDKMKEMEEENKKLKENLEIQKKEEEDRKKKEQEKKEKELKRQKELEEIERINKKIEDEIKKQKEKEEKEKQSKMKEELEKKEKERIKLLEEKQRHEKEEEEAKEQKKREEEKKEHAKKYPDGIFWKDDNKEKTEIKLIHLEIKFSAKKNKKDIEIFDIYGPSKPGYKFVNIEDNKYYVVFPFYKYINLKKIIFGIRDSKNEELINNTEISGEKHLTYNRKDKQWELLILSKKEDYEMMFNIYNVPKEINKVHYLKFLNKINLKNYSFTFDCVREVVSILKYDEILDMIMEIGINTLSEMLIKIIIERKIDIVHIASHLEKNKNTKYKDYEYEEIAPNIIYLFHSNNINIDDKGKKNLEENNSDKRTCLLCLDNCIPMTLNPENYQEDLIKNTSTNLGKLSLEETKTLQMKREAITKKLSDYNQNQKSHGLKEITCILTDTTVKKLSQLEYGIMANIPMIIQGFTSAGKSFLSAVSSKINNRECLSTALSEHTTIEDLLGRDVITNDSSIKFIPGILLLAYKDGKTLILDECDLAKPEILSCILGSMTKNELIICNQTFRKMDGYNVILTMNGEVKGFNEKQRNILTSNILSKFNLIPFDEMDKEECQEIFKNLLNINQNSKDYINNIDNFIELHQLLISEMKNKEEMKNNAKSIDPIVTLRNLKYCCYLSRNQIHPRFAAEISYTARFPKNERKDFENILNKFGDFQEDKIIKEEIEKNISNNFLYYNDTYKKVIYLSLISLKEGLHPLLIGEKGCGLTTVAKLVASIINQNYEFLLCSSETSVEDLIGCYQPQIKFKDKIQDLSSYIQWYDGPVIRAGTKGVPLILDNINYSKPQVIECLNPLLEDNTKYNNVTYNILEKENEGPINIKKGFCIIGTMTLDKENKNSISKALMNRFVAIYVDNDMEINSQNLDIIIENVGKKLDKQIKTEKIEEINDEKEDKYYYDNYEEDENEENETREIDYDENNEINNKK